MDPGWTCFVSTMEKVLTVVSKLSSGSTRVHSRFVDPGWTCFVFGTLLPVVVLPTLTNMKTRG